MQRTWNSIASYCHISKPRPDFEKISAMQCSLVGACQQGCLLRTAPRPEVCFPCARTMDFAYCTRFVQLTVCIANAGLTRTYASRCACIPAAWHEVMVRDVDRRKIRILVQYSKECGGLWGYGGTSLHSWLFLLLTGSNSIPRGRARTYGDMICGSIDRVVLGVPNGQSGFEERCRDD